MVEEHLGPGVQHGHHAHHAAAITAIGSKLFDGLCGSPHKDIVTVLLVAPKYFVQLFWNGKELEINNLMVLP